MPGNIKRIQLLSDTEVEELYARPEFSTNEQTLYFSLNKSEQSALQCYANLKTRVYFILQLGYFKATQQFFSFDFEEVENDTGFILSTYYSGSDLTFSGRLSRDYIRKQKRSILDRFNYRDWACKYEAQFHTHLCELLKYYPKAHSALRQLLGYFDSQQVVIPTYRKLQDMFTHAFSIEKKRINAIMLSIPASKQALLSNLISRDEGISQLNIIRADQKDFKYTAVKIEIEKAQSIVDLYTFAKEFIPILELSKNAICYYADLAEQYPASRLRRLSKPQQWLHMICFISHRYQQIMDNLIISFMYHIRAIMDAGKNYADMALMEHSSKMVVEFPKLAKFLKWFPSRDKQLTHETLNQIAYEILPEEQFTVLAEFLEGNTFDKKAAKWDFYLKSSRKFALYLRPILMAVPFEFYKADNPIIDMIERLKTHYVASKSPADLNISEDHKLIPSSMLPYLKRKPTDEHIDPHLFEFFVYQKMYHQLDRGRLFCNDSVSYGDIDNDLVDDALVDDVEKIAAQFGYPKIPVYCDGRLDDAINMLDDTWDKTVKNIRLELNTGFNLMETKGGKQQWSLLYDASEKLDDTFFKSLPKVEIANVVMFIGDLIGMWDSFSHIKDRYIKKRNLLYWLLMPVYYQKHLVLVQ